jgi:hypothetical protein
VGFDEDVAVYRERDCWYLVVDEHSVFSESLQTFDEEYRPEFYHGGAFVRSLNGRRSFSVIDNINDNRFG